MDPNLNLEANENISPAAGEPMIPEPVIGIPEFDPNLVMPEAPAEPVISEPVVTAPEETSAPGFPTAAEPSAPAADLPFNPVNPATAATPDFGALAATDPIMMPTQPKAPDPIEEELNRPLKAADPVPGSIGSAISMPPEGAAGQRTPSVAFNDPAMMAGQPATNQTKKSLFQKKAKTGAKSGAKTNRTTLIALAVVGVMVIIALVAVLIIQINS